MQEAETEFAAAQAGITDKTPLAQAAEQFNAAAVALEMAWLQLLGDSGCLTDAQQDTAAKAVSSYTKTLQQALADAGYYDAKVDGIYGPKTVAAVEALQKANGLPQTGTLDKATEKALRSELAAKGGAAAQEETASTAAVQQTLKLAGYWDGPVDGVWTDELTVALEKLQKDLGVKVTGTVDAATIAALEKAIAEAGAAPLGHPLDVTQPFPHGIGLTAATTSVQAPVPPPAANGNGGQAPETTHSFRSQPWGQGQARRRGEESFARLSPAYIRVLTATIAESAQNAA